MAILRSTSGKFYEIPDEQLSQYEVPLDLAEQVAALMGEGGGAEAGEAEAGGAEGGGVDPYGFGIHIHFRPRRRYWRNCWRNRWRNCY